MNKEDIKKMSREEIKAAFKELNITTSNCINCPDCPDCHDCNDCTDCKYCANCTNCHDCYDCYDCNDCYDCKYCTDLNSKRYHILNIKFTKEEYEEIMGKL